MKIQWKRVAFWSVTLSLPVLAFIQHKLAEQEIALFRKHKEEMVDCDRCKKLFHIRAGMSWILHLVDDHKFSSTHAIEIVEDLYGKCIRTKNQ